MLSQQSSWLKIYRSMIDPSNFESPKSAHISSYPFLIPITCSNFPPNPHLTMSSFILLWQTSTTHSSLDIFLQLMNIFPSSPPNSPSSTSIIHCQHLQILTFDTFAASSRNIVGKKMGFRFRLSLNPISDS